MADSDQGEKTEEPTQQRREDFRKRGQVAQTKELGSALALLSGLVAIWFLGRFFLEQIVDVYNMSFGDFIVASAKNEEWVPAAKFALKKSALIVGPITGVLWVVSFISSVVQIGFLTNEEAMQFKLDKINPIQGFKRIFSFRSVIEGLKAVVKVVIVAGIAGVILKAEIVTVPKLVSYDVAQILFYLGEVVFKLLASVGFFMVALAGMDYMFQRWDLEQKMRMTKQEVKEELKSREGDPLIKARIRRTQREMAQRRMMEDVPTADVIITNPTHIAVALKYSETMVAPTIVAMGAGVVAEKIKELAKNHSIPIIENKPLARTMFKTLQIGQSIPKELYTAVAEVLSYVYRLRKKMRRK